MVLPRIVVALALIANSDAFPFQPAKRSFTITQIEKRQLGNGTQPRNGAHAYARALSKYGAPSSDIEIAERAASAFASGPVAATPPSYADVEYDCPVTIGGQTFRLDLDTGSSDTWVLGAATGAGGSHTLYTPGKTATLQNGSSWKIGYGDGSSASGVVYSDTIQFGNTIVTGQAIEMANSASNAFTNVNRPSDGLMGLAFDKLNTVRPRQAPTFMTNAIKQGLPKKLFTARLKRGQAGTYNFGAINPREYIGPITYTPVDSSGGFWAFTPSTFAIGTGAQQTPQSGVTLKGIADTGTTLLLLDNSIVSAYYARVKSASYSSTYGGYIFPCATAMPNLTFIINGYQAVTPGSYLSYARVNSKTCYGGLQSNSGIGFNIYGDIFLKSQFVVFDQTAATPRLGFAIPR